MFLQPLFAQSTYTIRNSTDLKTVAAGMPTEPNAEVTIQFAHYQNLQFKVDKPHANVRFLQFQRSSSDSEAVIKVDSTFIDLRNMSAGTLVLKGLAFKLMNPKAVVLAGADNSKPNHDLVIDSCFFFGDSLDGSFLNWIGDAASRIEIRNSWFVFRGGRLDAAKMFLNGGDLIFANNLINYPGSIESQSITKSFEFRSNTLNRTQIAINGKLSGGKLPTYKINRNLFAHRHPHSVFGGDLYYVASIGSFDNFESTITYNRMYNTWKGFDYQNQTKFAADQTNQIDAVQDGKAVTELWNWYTEARDSITGMLSGSPKRSRYNVMPGDTQSVVPMEKGDLKVAFDSAQYPRNLAMAFQLGTVVLDPALRVRYPLNGWLTFGPFQVNRFTHPAKADFGKPILLAKDTGAFRAQPGSGRQGENPSVYSNNLPTARAFILADSGNTPRGLAVVPKGISLDSSERLIFAKVDSSGHTSAQETINTTGWPKDVRYLDRIFGFTTNAVVDSTVAFGTPSRTVPWHPSGDSVLWMQLPGTYHKTTREGARYLATARYDSKKTPLFMAYLVEKLSMPRGDTTLPLVGAELHSVSKDGYQIYVDSAAKYDQGAFGMGSLAYKIAWKGRAAGDLLDLKVKGHPLSQVFVKTADDAEPVLLPQYLKDEAGFFKVPIVMEDAGKTFFAAVRFNVIKDSAFTGQLDNGVAVTGYVSSTSGRLAFADVPAFPQSALDDKTPDFRNTRFLGGRSAAGFNVNPTTAYGLIFPIANYKDALNLEAWYLEGSSWKRIDPTSVTFGVTANVSKALIAGLKPSAEAVVVVERFQAPEIYFDTASTLKNGQLKVSLKPVAGAGEGLVAGFIIETRRIAPNGAVSITASEERPVKDTVTVDIPENQAVAWRIIYVMGSLPDTFSVARPFRHLEGVGWTLAGALTKERAEFFAGAWRLISIPATGKAGDMLKATGSGVDTARFKETTMVLTLKPTGAGFDTSKNVAEEPVRPGRAFFYAGTREQTITLPNPSLIRTARPETLHVKAGWNLVGNPYPIGLRKQSIRSVPPHNLTFRALNRNPLAPVGKRYSWDTVGATLFPFEGYAYNAVADEMLIFDPSDTTTPTAASIRKKPAAAASRRIRVSLDAPFGASSMALVKGPGEVPVGFLPTPAAGLELRVGGREGYLIKPVENPSAIDETVEIRSAFSGTAAFALEAGSDFALIDEANGMVYDREAARSLPVSAGARTYRLVAGDAGFVAERGRAFQAGLPAEIGLSQNFPNPFRGRTRIALDWPATRSADRAARLEVVDMQGRRVAAVAIRDIRAGRQYLDLDGSAWRPGLYLYRLTVTSAGRVSRLEKRMLVSP